MPWYFDVTASALLASGFPADLGTCLWGICSDAATWPLVGCNTDGSQLAHSWHSSSTPKVLDGAVVQTNHWYSTTHYKETENALHWKRIYMIFSFSLLYTCILKYTVWYKSKNLKTQPNKTPTTQIWCNSKLLDTHTQTVINPKPERIEKFLVGLWMWKELWWSSCQQTACSIEQDQSNWKHPHKTWI